MISLLEGIDVLALPGVGPTFAAVLVDEIGDAHRFSGPDKLCSWAGLTPKHRESDTDARRGTSPLHRRTVAAGSHAGVGSQIPWSPAGTRWGRSMAATGPSTGASASSR